MSTRSEIRVYNKLGKLKGCIYHHSDGYPSHIIGDLIVSKGENAKSFLSSLSKMHGTVDPKCAGGDTEEIKQGDLGYTYKLHYGDFGYPGKVEVFEREGSWDEIKFKKIFDGDIHIAHKKFVCEDEG